MVHPFPINKKDTMLNMKSVNDSLSHYRPLTHSFPSLILQNQFATISITFHISRSPLLCPYIMQPQQFKSCVS
jgi:hypothetical protein